MIQNIYFLLGVAVSICRGNYFNNIHRPSNEEMTLQIFSVVKPSKSSYWMYNHYCNTTAPIK